jgi:hypothetical protein
MFYVPSENEDTNIRTTGSVQDSNPGNKELVTLGYCCLHFSEQPEDPFAPRYKKMGSFNVASLLQVMGAFGLARPR